MTFDDRSACHMRTSPSIPTVFTLLHFPTQENIESMGDIGNRDTSCRREGMEKRKFPSGGLLAANRVVHSFWELVESLAVAGFVGFGI